MLNRTAMLILCTLTVMGGAVMNRSYGEADARANAKSSDASTVFFYMSEKGHWCGTLNEAQWTKDIESRRSDYPLPAGKIYHVAGAVRNIIEYFNAFGEVEWLYRYHFLRSGEVASVDFDFKDSETGPIQASYKVARGQYVLSRKSAREAHEPNYRRRPHISFFPYAGLVSHLTAGQPTFCQSSVSDEFRIYSRPN